MAIRKLSLNGWIERASGRTADSLSSGRPATAWNWSDGSTRINGTWKRCGDSRLSTDGCVVWTLPPSKVTAGGADSRADSAIRVGRNLSRHVVEQLVAESRRLVESAGRVQLRG